MPFSGHITDVARQGIWASLTGGWYYEPAHSLFCNTLHVYIWVLLFLFPVLLGISTNANDGQFGFGISLLYLCVIALVFIVIKLIVFWLHHIFDTVQPIKYKSRRSLTNQIQENTTQQRYRTGRFSGSSFSATRATESNAQDAIEMIEINPNSNRSIVHLNEQTKNNRNDSECELNEEPHHHDSFKTIPHSRYLSVPNNHIPGSISLEDEGEQSSSSSVSSTSKSSAHELLDPSQRSINRQYKGTLLRTTDSLDLLPIRRNGNRMPNLEREQKLFRLHHRRKYSEPDNMTFACSYSGGGSVGRVRRKQRRKSNERSFAIRRVNSSVDADAEERIKIRSSIAKTGSLNTHFPGGILVDELELNRWKLAAWRKKVSQRRKKRQLLPVIAMEQQQQQGQHEQTDNSQNESNTSKNEKRMLVEFDAEQQPCCSAKILSQDLNARKSDKFERELEKVAQKTDAFSSDLTSTLNTFESGVCSTSTGGNEELKGQIAKFLEELIEKHPETLMDAIESVRMNRLFQVGGQRQQTTEEDQKQSTSKEVQQVVTPQPLHQVQKHHLASDPTDTSQGAVHAFQDEQGNWYTYWFGVQSNGTAQPLISANEMTREHRSQLHRNPHRQLVRSGIQSEGTNTNNHGLPVTASVIIGKPHEFISINECVDTNVFNAQNNESFARIEKDIDDSSGQQPTTVNVIYRKQRSSSSSTISSHDDIRVHRATNRSRSSSSSDSATRRYLPQAPTNVIRAGRLTGRGGTASMDDGRMVPAAVMSQQLRPQGRQLSESSRLFMERIAFMQQMCQNAASVENPEFQTRVIAPLARVINRQLRLRTNSADNDRIGNASQNNAGGAPVSSNPPSVSPSINTVQLFNQLQMNRTLPPPFLFNFSRTDPNRSRLKYCYRLKMSSWLNWWPFGGKAKPSTIENEQGKTQKEFKLKLDRLSLASLFDRNLSTISCVFDTLLALLVSVLTALILSRHIYLEFSLLAFSFCVAGAQFSLLKSVQPDSASPVHGFNYLITYSRPIYFCALASMLLLLDWFLPPRLLTQNQWCWRPFWLRLYHDRNFYISPRDICADALLLLPIGFTFGLLPQVNTLCMHLLEQLDMHLFGATASLTLTSAIFSLSRSVLSVGILVGILRLVQILAPVQTVNTFGFSAFISLTVAIGYLLSRASSNPVFVKLILKAIRKRFCHQRNEDFISKQQQQQRQSTRSRQQQQRFNSSSSTLTTAAPITTKQLLNCCISTSNIERRSPTTTQEPTRNKRQRNFMKESTHDGSDDPNNKTNLRRQLQKEELEDELLSGISLDTLILRTQHDLFSVIIRVLLLFGIHCTSVFHSGQPYLEHVLAILCILFGTINHHIYPQLRAKHPWKLFAQPFLRPFEFHQFETTVEAKLTIFERIHIWMISLEKNILYPLLMASLMSTAGVYFNNSSSASSAYNNGSFLISAFLTLCAFKLSRTGFARPQQLYVPLLVISVIFKIGIDHSEESIPNLLYMNPLFAFFLTTIIWSKLIEFLLKLHFILCYLAPWQISWGSAFHAFAQPFSIPHSGLTLAQTIISSILSAPLNPFLGSSFFLMSYVRPIKFWERDYNTKRVDHSKMRLSSQLERGPMMDDSNLNSIFYEHLTRSLQKWLAGDLMLGRWACSIRPGDCFILASNYLNCMVQLVEVGNGFVTFQLRGLEFRGTYCHQREMEAISEDWTDINGACCCCVLGKLPGFISFNNAWTLRWLAWEVTVAKYVVDGYSISDNSAVNMLQVHELRRLLVTLYVKCMIYYAIDSSHIDIWLTDETILKALEAIRQNARYVDPDPVFCAANDEDYDIKMGGLSRQNFAFFYGDWIEHCLLSRSSPLALGPIKTEGTTGNGNPLVHLVNTFCFALSILGRRALGTAAYNRHASAAESFLFGMHALFKGDMRITHSADEWIFTDPEILTRVIAPAVRMALKLHQDHFSCMVDLDEPAELYERIIGYKEKIFISHENDPAWRRAILDNTPSLLALRHICDDGQDDYKVVMLNKRYLDMRVIKLNRECVRAFWAGQQQELIFLRNKNPERGSIQNARQVLRNMINSSADQPIGYPIYVSPLVTSFVETHPQLVHVLGPTLTFNWCWHAICSMFVRLQTYFGTSGSSSALHLQQPAIPMAVFPSSVPVAAAAVQPPPPNVPHHQQAPALPHVLPPSPIVENS